MLTKTDVSANDVQKLAETFVNYVQNNENQLIPGKGRVNIAETTMTPADNERKTGFSCKT